MSKQFVEIDEGWTHLIATFYYVEGALYELIEDFECVNPKVRVRGEPAAPSVEYCCEKISEKPEELMSLEEGVENEVIASYEYGVQLSVVIASSLFPCIPLGASSGLGAFGATPNTPHLGCHSHPLRESLRRLSTPHRESHQDV